MDFLFYLIGIYLVVINLDGYLLMRSDKKRAQSDRRRIPEATLFTVAVLGGALGIYLGMRRFRHKTLHTSFAVGIPLLIFFEAGLLAVLAYFLLKT